MCSELSLQDVLAKNGTVAVVDSELRITARAEFSKATIATITHFRDEIIEAWQERAGVREFDGGLSREEAERLASEDISGLHFSDRS
jgi:hypothetical protein